MIGQRVHYIVANDIRVTTPDRIFLLTHNQQIEGHNCFFSIHISSYFGY
jgi:hypothetical protein